MADITKCTAKNCKIKDTCHRYTAYDDMYQSYANFNNDKEVNDKKECDNYLKGRKKEVEVNERIIRK